MPLSTYHDLRHLPGSKGLPVLGQFIPFVSNATKFWTEQQKIHGDVFRFYTPMGASVVLLGPTANKYILVEQAKYATNKAAWEASLSDLFPNGLMLMDGDKHQSHRSIMNEAFKKDPMQGYLQMMPQIIDQELHHLNGKSKELMFPFFKRFTLKMAAAIFFGLDLNDNLDGINKALTDLVNAAATLRIKLPFTAYGKGLKGRKYLVSYFKSIIGERRQNPGNDLFSRLCQAQSEEGETFSDQEIIDHLIFVLMAAHDTTAITLSLMSYFLAKHPAWQDKVRAEANSYDIFGELYVNDLRQLENTGYVMKETLRIHPPLTLVSRKLEKELTIDGHRIPQNTLVNVVFQMTQKDDRVWTNPEKFDPLRFNKERREQSACPFAYAPFGAGKHHCIGYGFAEMQVKLVITELLKRFKLSVPEGYVCPIQDVPLKNPKDNLPIFLEAIL